MSGPGMAARHRAEPDVACPSCGRATGWRSDGTRRKHRTRADDPSAPYCPAPPEETP